ncbi:MAG: hypothetical protein E7417_02965 [Ruminococcaceae bacterium]|nr:hypothetical protein [Oscillospiraceae bacterium]
MAKKSKLKKVIITLITVLVSIVVAIGIAGLAVYNFVIIPKYNQYINTGEKEGEKLTNKDIVTFAKYFTNKDFVESITNISKDTAKDVLSTLLEIESEDEITEGTDPAEQSGSETGISSGNETTSPSDSKATPFISLTPEKTDIAFTQAGTSKLYSPTKNHDHHQNGVINGNQNVNTPQINQIGGANQQSGSSQPTATNPPPQQFEPLSKEDVPKKHQTAYDRIMAAASKEEIQAGMAIIAKVNMGKVNSLQSSGNTKELKSYIKSVLTSGEISTALRLYRKYKHLL